MDTREPEVTGFHGTDDCRRRARGPVGTRRRLILSTARTTVIIAYFAIAGALGGYIGATVATSEILQIGLKEPFTAPAPQQWADI